MSPVEKWLSEYVNSAHFMACIESEISLLDKPIDRLKARLELLSYLVPKVKGIDPLAPDANAAVSVTFVEAGAK
jgi:hypothetical protein